MVPQALWGSGDGTGGSSLCPQCGPSACQGRWTVCQPVTAYTLAVFPRFRVSFSVGLASHSVRRVTGPVPGCGWRAGGRSGLCGGPCARGGGTSGAHVAPPACCPETRPPGPDPETHLGVRGRSHPSLECRGLCFRGWGPHSCGIDVTESHSCGTKLSLCCRCY